MFSHGHFVPGFIPGFDFSYGLPPSCQRRLSAHFDYLRSVDNPPPSACPLTAQSRRLHQTRKPRAIAAPCQAEPRQRLRHWLYRPRCHRPFYPAPLRHGAGQHKAARLLAACRGYRLGCLNRCRPCARCSSQMNDARLRGKSLARFNITAHYPKQASRCAGLRLVAGRCAPFGFG